MIRKAKASDVGKIQKLINAYARGGALLPRSLNELYENIRDFFIWEEGGSILGCCALHIAWEDLAEIKSLTVSKRARGRGIGSRLLQSVLSEAKDLGMKKVFALTNQEKFFKKNGFKKIKKEKLPHKIWGECIRCPKFPDCDEVAMIFLIDN
ncbi:N-acetyltransferase [bacterium]|nr:N-acetyltransferase [bacterium]